MDGCIYRKKDGECDLYTEGRKFKAFCDPEHCDSIAPSNADCIRAMTDEELATWLNCMQSNAYHCGEFGRTNAAYPYNNAAWLDWLKQEAQDG